MVIKINIGAIIGIYLQPELSAAVVIDSLSKALNLVPRSERVVLAGDINCPIDKINKKTE